MKFSHQKWDTLSDAKANWDSLSDSTKDQYMEKTRQLMLKHIEEEAKNKEVELIKEEAKKEEVDNRISQYKK